MSDAPTRSCPNCGGTGEVAVREGRGLVVDDCSDCKGTGKVPYVGTKKPDPAPAQPSADSPPMPEVAAPAATEASA